MRRNWHRLTITLLILATLFAVAATPATAAAEPAVAAPRTYHQRADIALTLLGSSAAGYSEGDFDLLNKAFHVKATIEGDGQQVLVDIILLGDRIYSYNQQQQRWEYITLPQADLDLPMPGPTVPIHPTAAYQALGDETVDITAVQHWQAQGNYNVLLPLLSQQAFSGSFIQETVTADIFISAADNYLYRAIVQEQGTSQKLGMGQSVPQPLSSKTSYNYSAFNQPVTITAPEGAVPASDGTPPLDPRNPLGSVARIAQLANPLADKLMALIFLPTLVTRP